MLYAVSLLVKHEGCHLLHFHPARKNLPQRIVVVQMIVGLRQMQHAGQADFLLVLLERVSAGGTEPRVEKGDNIVQYPYVHRERRTRIADVYYIKIIKFLNKILLTLFG